LYYFVRYTFEVPMGVPKIKILIISILHIFLFLKTFDIEQVCPEWAELGRLGDYFKS